MERFFKTEDIGYVGCQGWFLELLNDSIRLKSDGRITPGSPIDVSTASMCMFRNLNTQLDSFLALPPEFGSYGHDDIFYSVYMRLLGFRGVYCGWENIAMHLGQGMALTEGMKGDYKKNAKIITKYVLACKDSLNLEREVADDKN
jgi:hypothetical protein